MCNDIINISNYIFIILDYMSFKPENIFFAMGHGNENLHDPQRYKLKNNQYAAIAIYPGEISIGNIRYSWYDIIIDKDIQIKIPKGGKQFTNDLGFANTLGGMIKNKYKLKIENFKIYRPKMGDYDKQKYWYTLPDLTYGPTAIFPSFYKDPIVKGIYKGIYYENLENKSLTFSGIIRKNTQLYFTPDDIKNFDKAYQVDLNEVHDLLKNKITFSITSKIENFIPFESFNDTIMIYFPKNTIDKLIIDIIKDKEKDPLTYDSYYWIKASYKASVIPLNDLCIMSISKDLNPDSPFDEYKRIKKEFNSKKKQEKFINTTLTLQNLLYINFKLKYVYDLFEEIVKPQEPYIVFPLMCRYSEATTRTIKSAKRKSRPRHTRKLKRNFYTKSKDEFE